MFLIYNDITYFGSNVYIYRRNESANDKIENSIIGAIFAKSAKLSLCSNFLVFAIFANIAHKNRFLKNSNVSRKILLPAHG